MTHIGGKNLEIKNEKPVVKDISINSRVYYIVFHSPNCINCNYRLPLIQKAEKKLSDHGFKDTFVYVDFSKHKDLDKYKKIVKTIPKVYEVVNGDSNNYQYEINAENLVKRYAQLYKSTKK